MVPSTVGQVFTCIKQWRLFLTQTTSTIYVSMFICTCVSICHEDLEARGQGEVLRQVTLSTVLHVYVCRVSSLDLELIKIGQTSWLASSMQSPTSDPFVFIPYCQSYKHMALLGFFLCGVRNLNSTSATKTSSPVQSWPK